MSIFHNELLPKFNEISNDMIRRFNEDLKVKYVFVENLCQWCYESVSLFDELICVFIVMLKITMWWHCLLVSIEVCGSYKCSDLQDVFDCFDKFEEELQNRRGKAREKACKDKNPMTTLQSIHEDDGKGLTHYLLPL